MDEMMFQDILAGQNRPKSTQTYRLIQGHETLSFKSKFDSWPLGSALPIADEGRGKVAGMSDVMYWTFTEHVC